MVSSPFYVHLFHRKDGGTCLELERPLRVGRSYPVGSATRSGGWQRPLDAVRFRNTPMADEKSDPESAADAGGIFGNLPASRPGTRSPRRKGATGTKSAGEPSAGSGTSASEPVEPAANEAPDPTVAGPATDSPVVDEPDPPVAEPNPPTAPPPGPQIKGVEDLAWAGVTVAAQAATAGVRFASRALEAARNSLDRP